MPTVTLSGGIDIYTDTTSALVQGTAQASSERASARAENRTNATQSSGDQVEISNEGRQKSGGIQKLSAEEQDKVDKLERRDQEVRTHEQAHIMAGGTLVRGGASFQYQTGPDGKKYAVGGEVSIDTSEVDGDPKATILKAQQIQKAALAPASPSGQDRAVAAEASVMQLKAQRELAQQQSAGGKAQPGAKLALSA